jgi:hypothetical protein
MTVLRQEQIVIVDQVIAAGGLSGRAAAHALGVAYSDQFGQAIRFNAACDSGSIRPGE